MKQKTKTVKRKPKIATATDTTVVVRGHVYAYLRLKMKRKRGETDEQLEKRALKDAARAAFLLSGQNWLIGNRIPMVHTLEVTTLTGSP